MQLTDLVNIWKIVHKAFLHFFLFQSVTPFICHQRLPFLYTSITTKCAHAAKDALDN